MVGEECEHLRIRMDGVQGYVSSLRRFGVNSHYSLKQIWRENSRYQSSATQQTARVQKRGTSSDATSEAGTKGRSKCRKPTKKQEAATELQRFLRKLDLVDQELEWERRERQRHMEMMQAQSWEREADRQQPGKQ
ncbi:uncharacterized protein [Narcine bancroftii]|uniref:uncharacterized protein isoform X4 n=1 Tax=Narcine bancroftii TaxID=1343680 RepID=UPI003831B724